MKNYFPKQPSAATLHNLSKLCDVLVGSVTPILLERVEAVYCFICGRWRVAVARYRMICLVLYHKRKCQLKRFQGTAHQKKRYLSFTIMVNLYLVGRFSYFIHRSLNPRNINTRIDQPERNGQPLWLPLVVPSLVVSEVYFTSRVHYSRNSDRILYNLLFAYLYMNQMLSVLNFA